MYGLAVIPATLERKLGGLPSKEDPGRSAKPCLKNKLKQKCVGVWLNL
jgi:hypothetical protein